MAKMTIKANRDYITIVLDKVTGGEYAIPEFQRDFIWSSRAIVELFDSIIKGYPIGSLILWKPESEKFKTIKDIGGISVANSESYADQMYILDGRQRITALVSVLYPNGKNYNHLYIDLDDMRILYLNGEKSIVKANLLKLGVAYDTYELVDFLEKLKASTLADTLKKEYADRAKKVNKTLLSYELGYISVHGGFINDAVEVFSRLNSKSTPISPDYMLQALAYNPDSDFLFAKEISAIQLNLQKYNFQGIKRDVLLRCAYTYADIPFIDGKVENLLKMKDELQLIMTQVAENVILATEFLFHQCGVIDYRLLPYAYQLVMLASFFRWNKEPRPDQIKELKKWFFYTTYSAYFTNTSLSVIREDIRRFTDYAKGGVSTPIEYNDEIDFKRPDTLNLGGVRACAFVISTILQHNLQKDNAHLEIITMPHTGLKNIGNSFICTSREDVETVLSWLTEKKWIKKLYDFGLTENLAKIYGEGEEERFMELRTAYLAEQEETFMKALLFD